MVTDLRAFRTKHIYSQLGRVNYCKNGQPSKYTRLIKEDAQPEWKKSRDTSRADSTDLWCSEEVVLLAKP